MTEIYGKEKKLDQVKVLLTSESHYITRNEGEQPEIKIPEKNTNEIIRIKSAQDPFKFIAQSNQRKENIMVRSKLKPEIKMYRQGDILFKKLVALPEHLKENSDNIVAGGEGTAHTHMLVNGDLFQAEYSDQKYIRARENTRLIHEEHLPIKLESGNYEVVRQREYLGTGLVKRERFVVD